MDFITVLKKAGEGLTDYWLYATEGMPAFGL